MNGRETKVELIDDQVNREDGMPLIPNRVKINGVDVGWVAEDGITIEGLADPYAACTVRIPLLATDVVIRAPEAGEY